MKRLNLFTINLRQSIHKILTCWFKYFPYFIDKQNVIPVCVSPNGLNNIHEKDLTLKELMRIKDICQNHPSDYYILTPWTIKQLGININGSTIEAYTQAQPQEIRSFIKCVLPKHHKWWISLCVWAVMVKAF